MHAGTEKTVDRESREKLYVQMYLIIKQKVESGQWKPGEQIPTEEELCRLYNVSKAPVRMAISELVRSGYLRKQQGKGTFVTFPRTGLGIAMRTMLTEDMFGKGVSVEKVILRKGVTMPDEGVRAYLQAGGEVFYILCKRVVNGEPACIEEVFIPVGMVPGIEKEDICKASFYDLINEKAVKKIGRVVQTIEISGLSGEIAEILLSQEGDPALLLHRLIIGPDRIPIAYTRLVGSGRKYKIQTELERIA